MDSIEEGGYYYHAQMQQEVKGHKYWQLCVFKRHCFDLCIQPRTAFNSVHTDNFHEFCKFLLWVHHAIKECWLFLWGTTFPAYDNPVLESIFAMGSLSSHKIYKMVLELWQLEQEGDLGIKLIHNVAGTQLKVNDARYYFYWGGLCFMSSGHKNGNDWWSKGHRGSSSFVSIGRKSKDGGVGWFLDQEQRANVLWG